MQKNEALGIILEYFCWLDGISSDGSTHMTPKQLDTLFSKKNLTKSLCEIGWASIDDKGNVYALDFDVHNGECAKKRACESEKKRKQRGQQSANVSPKNGDKCPRKSGTNVPEKRGPEKRREEKDFFTEVKKDTPSEKLPTCRVPLPESSDDVLRYMASLPICGLKGDDLLTCAETFFSEFDSVGWVMRGQPITNWNAAARSYLTRWQNNSLARAAAAPRGRITYRSETDQNYEL